MGFWKILYGVYRIIGLNIEIVATKKFPTYRICNIVIQPKFKGLH